MAKSKTKYGIPHDDIREIFEAVLEQSMLTNYINVSIVSDNKMKKVATHQRSNEMERFKTNDDLNIIVNETIFEQLTPEQQILVAEETIAGYHYDTEKDKLVYRAPDVVAHSGIIRKYGFDKWTVKTESVNTLLNVKQQQEDETDAIVG